MHCEWNPKCYSSDERCNGVENPGLYKDSLDLAVSGSVGREGTTPRNQENSENDKRGAYECNGG